MSINGEVATRNCRFIWCSFLDPHRSLGRVVLVVPVRRWWLEVVKVGAPQTTIES